MSERDDLTEQAYHSPELATPSGTEPHFARRTITIDLDTGEWLFPITLGNGDGWRVASSVLPGMPEDAVFRAYAAWMNADPAPMEPDHEQSVAEASNGFDFLLTMQTQVEELWGRRVDPTDPEAVSKYIRETILCTTDELHEVLAEVHWKPWKDHRGIKDWQKYREEMADVLHFILNLYLAAGLDGQNIVVDYLTKHYENIERHASAEYRAS